MRGAAALLVLNQGGKRWLQGLAPGCCGNHGHQAWDVGQSMHKKQNSGWARETRQGGAAQWRGWRELQQQVMYNEQIEKR